jgi:nucleoid-associated protein YgaU
MFDADSHPTAAHITGILNANELSGVVVHIDAEGVCHLSGEVQDQDQLDFAAHLAGQEDIAAVEVHIEISAGEGEAAIPTEEYDFSETVTYDVKKGDSWWKIAKKFYDDGRLHAKLKEANGSPKMLHPGDVVSIPSKDMLG